MHIQFSKYQGTGNDFIMLNNLDGMYNELTLKQIQYLCDRRFGIGADGLIKINRFEGASFEVDYYNADGTKSFCGNGARCSVSFAEKIGLYTKEVHFMAIDGMHYAENKGNEISLQMLDVTKAERLEKGAYVLNTGSPHYVVYVDNVLETNVYEEGRKIRYSLPYREDGINVNFVETYSSDEIEVSTYERGVEDETLSCGTGVTAAALVHALSQNLQGEQRISIHTKGGKLTVAFKADGESFSNIQLIGPAEHVFDGQIEL